MIYFLQHPSDPQHDSPQADRGAQERHQSHQEDQVFRGPAEVPAGAEAL